MIQTTGPLNCEPKMNAKSIIGSRISSDGTIYCWPHLRSRISLDHCRVENYWVENKQALHGDIVIHDIVTRALTAIYKPVIAIFSSIRHLLIGVAQNFLKGRLMIGPLKFCNISIEKEFSDGMKFLCNDVE